MYFVSISKTWFVIITNIWILQQRGNNLLQPNNLTSCVENYYFLHMYARKYKYYFVIIISPLHLPYTSITPKSYIYWQSILTGWFFSSIQLWNGAGTHLSFVIHFLRYKIDFVDFGSISFLNYLSLVVERIFYFELENGTLVWLLLYHHFSNNGNCTPLWESFLKSWIFE